MFNFNSITIYEECKYRRNLEAGTYHLGNSELTNFFGRNITLHTIVGKNGSGKSSLLDIVFRMVNNVGAVMCKREKREASDKIRYARHIFADLEYEKEKKCKLCVRDVVLWLEYGEKVYWLTDCQIACFAEGTIDDLDTKAIAKAREGYKQRYPRLAKECDGWDDKVFLDKAGLTIDGKVTRTTLLLVGKETSAHKLNHIAQIVWKCFQDGQVFGDIYTIPFVLTTTELLGRIRNYRFKIYPKDSLIPAEVWKYDTESILEGMHNSIAHQQYEKNARIIVTENMDSLKFQNDGNFYEGDYKEYITGEKTPKSYRNPALVKAMVNIRMIDTQGYGIHKMY